MKIAVCCWMKDEDKIIREWIAHYLNLGFDKIYLFDNMSSIPVSSYISHPNVIIKLDNNPKEDPNWGQGARYNEFLNENRDMDWIFCCDADELLSLRINKSLKDFLSEFSDDTAVIPVNWVTFGQGRNKTFDNSKLVIEQFTIREEYKCFWNFFVKSFIRPNLITKIVNWHYHDSGKYKSKNVYNEHIRSSKQSTIKEVTQERDRLNDKTPLVLHHYMTLDKESMRIKRNRNNNVLITCDKYTDEWYSKNFKDNIKDESMLKYVSDIKKTIHKTDGINNSIETKWINSIVDPAGRFGN